MIVLLKNGRRKEEAMNELKIFLADDSDSFVAWYIKMFLALVEETFVRLFIDLKLTRKLCAGCGIIWVKVWKNTLVVPMLTSKLL